MNWESDQSGCPSIHVATDMINGPLTLVTKSIPLAFKSVFTFGFGSFENKHTVTVLGLTIGCGKGLQTKSPACLQLI